MQLKRIEIQRVLLGPGALQTNLSVNHRWTVRCRSLRRDGTGTGKPHRKLAALQHATADVSDIPRTEHLRYDCG
jgi:hypothetical protein